MSDDRAACQEAKRLIETGDYRPAIDLMQPLSERRPEAADIWHLLGMARHKSGDAAGGIQCLLMAAAIDNRNPVIWLDLGDAFETSREWSAAIDAYLMSAGFAPATPHAHRQFLRCVANTIEDPEQIAALAGRWAGAFVEGGRLEDALERMHQLFGGNDDQWYRGIFLTMSRVLFLLGRDEEAVDTFTRHCRPAGHGPQPTHDVCNDYREISATYENMQLPWRIAENVVNLAKEAVGERNNLRILDAACGTGLVGLLLRGSAARLVGIDLSPAMLAEAEAKGVYDELAVADIARALAGRDDRFDLITCSDALYHLADISGFFAGAASCLAPGGSLAISVDPLSDSGDFAATMLGGFAHSRRYLRRLAAENGLAEITVRLLEHRGHPGFYCAFRGANDG